MKRSNFVRIMLACAVGLLFVARANAANINGTWAHDVLACSRALIKENNRISIYEKGVFIIDDKEIRGKSATCNIKAREDDGHFVRLLVECPASIAGNLLTLRVDDINKFTRIFPGMPKMNTTYFRCQP
jgi:hypothetical protein